MKHPISVSTKPAAGQLMPILMAIMANKASGGGIGNLGGLTGGGQGGAFEAGQGGGLGGLLGNLLGGSAGASGTATPGGSLSDALGGMLGGSGLSGALGQIVSSFQQSGHGSAVDSWVSNGPNAPVAPHQVKEALGSDTLDQLSRRTGVPQGDIASQLSQLLPQMVNQLTPNGRLPTSEEASKWI